MTHRHLMDSFGRRITYLRISVTDRCDLRCVYCMPERMAFAPKRDLLTLEELELIAAAFIERGVTKIRITGGEPLLRRDAPLLMRRLGARLGHGLDELSLTTNATQLTKYARDLAEFGVRRVNVSLDTLNDDVFEKLTRRRALSDVLRGIDAAQEAGLKVKINTVALADANRGELPSIIEWAHGRGMAATLIEVMPLGEIAEDRADQYVPLSEVRAELEKRWTLEPMTMRTGGPARYVNVAETGGALGFITPLTQNFCDGCNRVRVTCAGRIYACLGDDGYLDLRAALRGPDPDAALEKVLDRAMATKPERHHFSVARGAAPSVARHMSATGG